MCQLVHLKKQFSIILIILSMWVSVSSWATGPRITKSFLSPNENQIYSKDFPPFSTTDLATGGLNAEIIDAVLKLSDVDAAQTIVPLQSMVKFHLEQEKALAIYGRSFNFSDKEKHNLIYIPISLSNENYIYYKPVHNSGIAWNGSISSLKGLSYGAYKGENLTKFRNSQVEIVSGRTHSLLKKLISGKVDIMSMSDLNMNWVLDNHFKEEKPNFDILANSSVTLPIFIIFNKEHPEGELISKKFGEGLGKIIANGEYVKIVNKYIVGEPEQALYMEKFKDTVASYQ